MISGMVAAGALSLFNIYASTPASDPAYPQKTDQVIARLGKCGVKAGSDMTDMYRNLTPGLVVVITGPHRDRTAAQRELARARTCAIKGYTKPAELVGGE